MRDYKNDLDFEKKAYQKPKLTKHRGDYFENLSNDERCLILECLSDVGDLFADLELVPVSQFKNEQFFRDAEPFDIEPFTAEDTLKALRSLKRKYDNVVFCGNLL